MGKGDKRTKRGKIHIGSTGVTRQKKKVVKKVAAKKSDTAKAPAKKASAKKAE
jgi:ribosomal small subunit protein bTHX